MKKLDSTSPWVDRFPPSDNRGRDGEPVDIADENGQKGRECKLMAFCIAIPPMIPTGLA